MVTFKKCPTCAHPEKSELKSTGLAIWATPQNFDEAFTENMR